MIYNNVLIPNNVKEFYIRDKYRNVKLHIFNSNRQLKMNRVFNSNMSFDCETYKGKCWLIADNSGRYLYKPTFKEILEFMCYKINESNNYRWFFNIDFDIGSILKTWYNIDKIKELKNGKEVQYKDYSLFWLKKIMFVIKKNKRKVIFTDLYKFFHESLESSFRKYVNYDSKNNIDGNLLNTSKSYWNNNLTDIINYCIKDCQLTNKLADILIKAILEANISLPRYLCSSGSLAKADFRTNCIIPNLRNVPNVISQIAYWCYYGGRFEIFRRGTFKTLYVYDINSQYPSFIQYLPNLDYGVWIIVSEINRNQIIGYYLVDLDIPDYEYCSTIPYKLKNNMILNVVGKIKNKWLTWYDIDLMREYITKLHIGFEFYPKYEFLALNDNDLDKYYPFYHRITFHYSKKNEYKGNNEMMYQTHKLDMNAFYGCNIERHFDNNQNTVGKLFNPIYASQTTAFGRWSVIKELKHRDIKNLCGIHTDSIITDKPIDYLPISDKLGNWNLEGKGKGLIVGSGMYQIGSKKAVRGIPKDLITDWFKILEKNRNKSRIKFKFKRPRKVSECLVRDKNLEFVNVFMDDIKRIRVNSDLKRNWIYEFENFEDFLNNNVESLHWYVNMSNKKNQIEINDLMINPNYY